jgi:hypothetical protein
MLLAHGSSGHWPVAFAALALAAGVHCAAAGKKVRTRDAVHTLLILFQFSKVRCRPGSSAVSASEPHSQSRGNHARRMHLPKAKTGTGGRETERDYTHFSAPARS